MKITLLPLIAGTLAVCPSISVARQTPPQPPAQTTAPDIQGQVPPPAKSQTPVIMPKLVTIPTPPAISIDAAAVEGAKALTADEAGALALRVQPSLRIAEADLLAAQGRLQVVRAGLLPTLSLSSTYTRDIYSQDGRLSFPTPQNFNQNGNSSNSSSSTPGVFSGLSTIVTLHQLLFDFGHTRELVAQAEADRRAAERGLTAAQQNLVYAVKQAFYTYRQDQELLKVQNSNLVTAKAEFALALASLQVGLGEPSDAVTAITSLGNASSAVASAQQAELIARINLALAIGVDPRTPIEASTGDETVPAANDLTGLVTIALKTRPDLLQAQQTLISANHGLSSAKTTNAPSLDLNIQGEAAGTGSPTNNSSGSVGLSLSWAFEDGGLTAGTVKQARATVISSQSQVDSTRLQAISDVSQSYVNLHTAEQRITIAKAAVADAQTGLSLSEGRYKAGVAVFIEVTTAESNLVQAQTNLVTAQIDLQTARAQLKHAIGTI